MSARRVVLLSPLLIIAVNLAAAYGFRPWLGKWSFVPMILLGWGLWGYFISKYGGRKAMRNWLAPARGSRWWLVPAILTGLLPLPIFLFHYETLASWTVWLPWLVLALVNPWIEEGYWRGLLLDYTRPWPAWAGIAYGSAAYALNHAAFGVNSEINAGYDVVISTFIMGLVWAGIYHKTGSLRYPILAHVMVDLLALSVPAFLDLWEKGTW